ncbi:hypothetical protein DSO57_1013898 [Entomophthora muscae]|uniref:Uncharacterized protein n=1 Tax=Entomophthora muscae TaxID=34485 RepID=A0ACC2TGQ1_9FUNG|nr:hypothetical protein DSO57_1013898 [Entomophthora muscae]
MLRSLLSSTFSKGSLTRVSQNYLPISEALTHKSCLPVLFSGFNPHKPRFYPGSSKVLRTQSQQSFKNVNFKPPSENSHSDHTHGPSILGGSLSFALVGSVLCFVSASFVFQNRPSKAQVSLEKGKDCLAYNSNDGSPRAYNPSDETSFEFFLREFRSKVNQISSNWEGLPRHEKAIWGIIGINTLVFAAWKIPRFQPFMTKHFMHAPNSDRYYTMITSAFSHNAAWHLGCNIFVLKEFGTFAGHSMCAENLVAFYLTAGILASLVRRVVFSGFPHKVSQNFLLPGLGASGAVFGLFSFSAYQVPQNPAYIAFLPGVEFKLSELLAFFMTIDFIGVVRGWHFFGHHVRILT